MGERQRSFLLSPAPHCTSPAMDGSAGSEEGLQSPEGRGEGKAEEKGRRRRRGGGEVVTERPALSPGEFPLPEAAPPGRIRRGRQCDPGMRREKEHSPSSPSFHLRSSVAAGEPRGFRHTVGGANSSAGSHSKPAHG